jgi:hypothetical protein
MSRTDDDGSLLSRWAMRKRAVAEQELAERDQVEREEAGQAGLSEARTPDAEPPDAANAETGHPQEETEQEILERLGLPDPDAMEKGDDFSAFMASAVPARIRNRALRKLWISNPVLANLDELVDYGEDFTDAATVIENLQTAYQVGRGFMRDEDYEDQEEDLDDPESAAETGDEIAASDDVSGEDSLIVSDADTNPDTNVDQDDSFASATLPGTASTTAELDQDSPPNARSATDDPLVQNARTGASVESNVSTYPLEGEHPEAPAEIPFDMDLAAKPRQKMRFRFN